MVVEKKQSKMDFQDAQSAVEKGLQSAYSNFEKSESFSWDLFEGFDEIRVLTYSSSINTILDMLDKFKFNHLECVFGYEGVLGKMADIIAVQQYVKDTIREYAIKMNDSRQERILEYISKNQASFHVVRDQVSHSKIYLLQNTATGQKRVITGSANFSERGFGGKQAETLIVYDDDEPAWDYFVSEYEAVKATSTDKLQFPDNFTVHPAEFTETPIMESTEATVFRQETQADLNVSVVIRKVEALAEPIERIIGPQIKRQSNNVILTPKAKSIIKELRWKKQSETDLETRPDNLSIEIETGTVTLSGSKFDLEVNEERATSTAVALIEYFNNYQKGFEGDVERLQRQYFIFMSWLWASPFICDLRSRATFSGENIFRYPSFAVIFGKSNCGKTSLVETLMTAMFGTASSVQKDHFTRRTLRGLQENYGRFPVVFDDISRRKFTDHGLEIIKDESLPRTKENPGFVVSMNAEIQSFPDEVMKRCLMIYANTSLPNHKHALGDELHKSVENIRSRLTTDLYKAYLSEMISKISESDLIEEDILKLSSATINSLLEKYSTSKLPDWCNVVTWSEYADQRYERQVKRLSALLATDNYQQSTMIGDQGWTLKGDKVVIWEKSDLFGRKSVKGEIPDYLYDDDTSVGDQIVLYKQLTEDFLGINIRKPRKKWFFQT